LNSDELSLTHTIGYNNAVKKIRLAGVLTLIGVSSFLWWHYWREHRFDSLILTAARKYQIDPALVKAVIWRETHFSPGLRGRVGEIGLMQLRPAATQEWAQAEHIAPFQFEDCWNPASNVLAGTWYLKKVLKRYSQTDNPASYALADYNAGRRNALKWNYGSGASNSAVFIAQIEFPSTKGYVQAILHRRERYKRDFAEGR
jgi:soluble lytic murein transglycosylase